MPAQLPEKWLPVPGYEGFYEVSDRGRVYSLPRAATAGGYLRPRMSESGARAVRLSKYGKPRVFLIATLVLRAFGPPRPNKRSYPLHGPGGLLDDAIGNLSWVTWEHGRPPEHMPPVRRGEQTRTAKLTAEIVADCRRRFPGVTQAVLRAQYGVSSTSMSQAIHGETWKHVTDPPPVPRSVNGRKIYANSPAGRAQRRQQAIALNERRRAAREAVNTAKDPASA